MTGALSAISGLAASSASAKRLLLEPIAQDRGMASTRCNGHCHDHLLPLREFRHHIACTMAIGRYFRRELIDVLIALKGEVASPYGWHALWRLVDS